MRPVLRRFDVAGDASDNNRAKHVARIGGSAFCLMLVIEGIIPFVAPVAVSICCG